ncbi:lysophosphatidylserine lipase ABHD12-like [Fundulus diaphanus]
MAGFEPKTYQLSPSAAPLISSQQINREATGRFNMLVAGVCIPACICCPFRAALGPCLHLESLGKTQILLGDLNRQEEPGCYDNNGSAVRPTGRNRAAPHRVGVAKLLSALGYHVLVPDYRGFGDSTGEPTESGLTTDALHVYNWVKARSGDSLVVIWGHSLGTGVTCNTAVKLLEDGVVFDGVILEGAFNAVRQQIPFYVFSWYYSKFPGIKNLFSFLWEKKVAVFNTERNLKQMRSPILFLHSEDDHLVPIDIARQTYAVAAKAQGEDRVKLVTFDGSLGYLHNGLYRDPKLPGVLKEFVKSL